MLYFEALESDAPFLGTPNVVRIAKFLEKNKLHRNKKKFHKVQNKFSKLKDKKPLKIKNQFNQRKEMIKKLPNDTTYENYLFDLLNDDILTTKKEMTKKKPQIQSQQTPKKRKPQSRLPRPTRKKFCVDNAILETPLNLKKQPPTDDPYTSIKSKLDQANGRIGFMTRQINQLQKTVTTMNSQIETKTNKLAECRKQNKIKDNKIKTQAREIESLKNKSNDLKKKIKLEDACTIVNNALEEDQPLSKKKNKALKTTILNVVEKKMRNEDGSLAVPPPESGPCKNFYQMSTPRTRTELDQPLCRETYRSREKEIEEQQNRLQLNSVESATKILKKHKEFDKKIEGFTQEDQFVFRCSLMDISDNAYNKMTKNLKKLSNRKLNLVQTSTLKKFHKLNHLKSRKGEWKKLLVKKITKNNDLVDHKLKNVLRFHADCTEILSQQLNQIIRTKSFKLHTKLPFNQCRIIDKGDKDGISSKWGLSLDQQEAPNSSRLLRVYEMFEKAPDIIPNLRDTIMEHKKELKILAENSTALILCLPAEDNKCKISSAIISSTEDVDPNLQSWQEKSMILYDNKPSDHCLQNGNMAAEMFT